MSEKKTAAPHTTHQEIEFIENIGMYGQTILGHKKLLVNYIKASAKRELWGDVDEEKAIDHATFCLSKLN